MSYPVGIKHTDEMRSCVRDLYASGLSLNRVAAKTGVGGTTVFKWCRDILRSKSAALTGHIKSETHRKNLSRALRGHAVSDETRRHQSEAHKRRGTVPPSRRGCTPWNYRGVTPEHEKVRKSAEYTAWRDKVFHRDRYTCRQCGVCGGRLRAHHIKPFSVYPELRLVVDNGLTLCDTCHAQPGLHGGWHKKDSR